MAKRIGLIMVRERLGYSKKAVAAGANIDRQRYGRIESGDADSVDISEAYSIARFLGFDHPYEIFLSENVQKINNNICQKPQAS
ncbi:helix-turn-helix transcriptional regulator [Pelosinus sp. sgz500959]|uniref:helix-turn-helix transcriptional regulator n=1 Tax=Pelosinus sp. sgz500959 TaxID=3242472 RepID=UPI00366B9D0C